MPDYLTKEEIRQWRSSLERITLEDYAKKLGKTISDEKETNDIVDMVYKHSNEVRFVSDEETSVSKYSVKAERISSLAQQSFEREKELNLHRDVRPSVKPKKETPAPKAPIAKKEIKAAPVPAVAPVVPAPTAREEFQVTFKKNLTPREQAVFEHFLNNKNNIVYAKELAIVLELPRDYVYKYIKNLRAKMNEDAIQNADNGGFVLEVK